MPRVRELLAVVAVLSALIPAMSASAAGEHFTIDFEGLPKDVSLFGINEPGAIGAPAWPNPLFALFHDLYGFRIFCEIQLEVGVFGTLSPLIRGPERGGGVEGDVGAVVGNSDVLIGGFRTQDGRGLGEVGQTADDRTRDAPVARVQLRLQSGDHEEIRKAAGRPLQADQ